MFFIHVIQLKSTSILNVLHTWHLDLIILKEIKMYNMCKKKTKQSTENSNMVNSNAVDICPLFFSPISGIATP